MKSKLFVTTFKNSDPAKNQKKPLFYCGSCQNLLKDKPKVYKDFCVACDICHVWFHYKCVWIPREKEVNNDAWLCSNCKKLDTTLK